MKKILLSFLLIPLLFSSHNNLLPPSSSLDLIDQIGGSNSTLVIYKNFILFGEGLRINVLSISNLDRPILIGRTAPFNGHVNEIVISENYAFVLIGDYEIHILNLLNTDHPKEVGTWKETCQINSIKTYKEYLAISCDELKLIDISDVSDIKEIYSTQNTDGDFEFYKNYLYIGDEANLKVVDISDETNIQEISTIFISNAISSIAINNKTMVILDTIRNFIKVIDISDPENPVVKATENNLSNQFHFEKIAIKDKYLYLLGSDGGVKISYALQIIDIGDPSYPKSIGVIDPEKGSVNEAMFSYISDMVIKNNNIFFSNSNGQVISIQLDLLFLGKYEMRKLFHTMGNANTFLIDGSRIYATSMKNGLWNLTYQENESFKIIENIETGDSTDFLDIKKYGDYLYVETFHDVVIFDSSNKSKLIKINTIKDTNKIGSFIVDKVVLINTNSSKVKIAEIKDPKQVNFISEIEVNQPVENSYVGYVWISNNLMYVISRGFGNVTVNIFDITDLKNIKEINKFLLDFSRPKMGEVEDVFSVGNYCFISGLVYDPNFGSTTWVLNFLDPLKPKIISDFQFLSHLLKVDNEEHMVVYEYLSKADQRKEEENHITIYSISDPNKISEIGDYSIPASLILKQVNYGNGLFIASAGSDGLLVFKSRDNNNNIMDGVIKGNNLASINTIWAVTTFWKILAIISPFLIVFLLWWYSKARKKNN